VSHICQYLATSEFDPSRTIALFAGREASTLLFGLKPWDPATLVDAAVLLAMVAVVASLVPSIRAANVNPIDSLRAE
jgi:ABC-type antimicrobial peptide transport system permease subunit